MASIPHRSTTSMSGSGRDPHQLLKVYAFGTPTVAGMKPLTPSAMVVAARRSSPAGEVMAGLKNTARALLALGALCFAAPAEAQKGPMSAQAQRYKKACQAGEHDACYHLGKLYLDGKGVARN